MPHSGSKPHNLRTAVVAAVFAAIIGAVAWALIHNDGAAGLSTESPAATATGSPQNHEEQKSGAAAASNSTRKLKGSVNSAALPPAGAPLAQTYKDLKSRADAGDPAAASRLFRDTYRCVQAREQLLGMPTAAVLLLEGDASKLSAEQLAGRERHLTNLAAQLDAARKESQKCEGLDDTQLLVTPTMLAAARLGDLAAGTCYVEGSMMFDPRLFDHPEWLPEFKSSAVAIAQAFVAKGDWAAVAQLQHAYARDGYGGLLLGRVIGPDPVQNYRYLKLRRLGANAENAPFYDRDLSFSAHGLSDDQIAAGDAWAQDTYLRYFGAAPENSVGAHNSPLCSNLDD